MKKILVSLLVLAICAPAMADVAVTAVDSGSGVLTITVTPTAGAVVRGVGLVLGTSAGDGVADSGFAAGLNTNIDYFYTNGVGGVVGDTPNGEGHPLADPAAPGVAALPAADVSLCAGYLDAAGTQAGLGEGDAAMTFTVNYTGTADTTVTIALDELRGGITGDNIGTVTVVDATQVVVLSTGPACWAWPCQPFGDANGDNLITSGDVQTLLGAWPPNPYDPCADFNQDGVITSGDVQTLLAVWGVGCP